MTTRQEGHDHPEAGSCKVSAAFDALLENDDVVYQTTQIFDALSDFTRFQILGVLMQGEKSVSEIQEVSSVSQSAVSHQLRMLRDRGLVTARRDGQRMFYSLADEHVAMLIRLGLEHAAESLQASEA